MFITLLYRRHQVVPATHGLAAAGAAHRRGDTAQRSDLELVRRNPSTTSKFADSSPSFVPGRGLKSTSSVLRARGSRFFTTLSRALAGCPLTSSCDVNTRRPFWLTAT